MVDVYEAEYDYDDLKISACITDYVRNVKHHEYLDFEVLAMWTMIIHRAYLEEEVNNKLSWEEIGYVQKFAYRYLEEHYEDLLCSESR